MTHVDDPMTMPQGDLRLLETDVARRLLKSTGLARVAYVAKDGTPRAFPMLFHWTGSEVVLSTFGGLKVSALRARPDIAITIDAATNPALSAPHPGESRRHRRRALSQNTHWPSAATPARNRAPRTSRQLTGPARRWSASLSVRHGPASSTLSPGSPAARRRRVRLARPVTKNPQRPSHPAGFKQQPAQPAESLAAGDRSVGFNATGTRSTVATRSGYARSTVRLQALAGTSSRPSESFSPDERERPVPGQSSNSFAAEAAVRVRCPTPDIR
jgi:hypothetical protein